MVKSLLYQWTDSLSCCSQRASDKDKMMGMVNILKFLTLLLISSMLSKIMVKSLLYQWTDSLSCCSQSASDKDKMMAIVNILNFEHFYSYPLC